MSTALVLAIGMALAFAFTNGFHDAANAIATLVATRVARPGQAVLLAAVFNMIGPFLIGEAVANTIGKIVDVPADEAVTVIGAGLTGAVLWNIATWWRGLPSSSSHALVGGLVGAAIATAGVDAVTWGGIKDGWHPYGVIGTLIALAVSPIIGLFVAWVIERLALRLLRRSTTRITRPVRGMQWVTSSWLALSHGSNDAQKAVGIVGALLVASGDATSIDATPAWATFACAGMLTLGTALGGWKIVKTIGRKIYALTPLDGLVSQISSAGVILAATYGGAPVSTTHVVSSSVVGIGLGRKRVHHIGWQVTREMGIAWLTTIPASAAIAIVFLPIWRWIS